MSKWIIGLLVAVIAASTLSGVEAQGGPAEPESANVDVTVWRRVSDPTLLYVSTRPEGGRWRTLDTPLDMSMRSDSGNFDQSNAVRVRVPLEGGGTANVDVTVWRRVSDPTLLYVSTRPEGGRWRTLDTPLDMSMRSDSGNFDQSNAVRVEVPLPGLPAYTCIDASRHTPLHTAVDTANTQLVRIIAASCPQYLDNVSGEFFYDQTPLSLAIGGGEAGIVQILVDAGADPDRRIEPAFRVGTHLTYAIGLAEYDIAKILLDADADPNVVDKEQFYDQTPLSLAIYAADEDLLRNLIAAGADPNKKVSPDFRVGTHLTYAVGLGDAEVVQILLDADADPNVIDREQFHDQTPLSLAINARDQDMLRRLIAAGADPNKKVSPDFRVGTHLTYAVGKGDVAVVQTLLDAGADPNVVDTEQFYEESPLSLAVKAQDIAMVRALLNAGADPNKVLDQFNDVSPLDIATEEGYTEIVQLLLAGGSSTPSSGGPPDEPSSGTQSGTTSPPTTSPTAGECTVNLVVSAGESCTYPNTSTEFSVDGSGNGTFLILTSGTSISLLESTVNGVLYNFEANNQGDGSWIITTVGTPQVTQQ
ncbi:MAG: ankyrin repeat domain-containing protein [Chloroflexota bacterium]|nr:ankyrin repeat domain-containing protein [Chloroflexota bacterium]